MISNGKEVDIEGNIRYYKDGEYHREDGPAIEWRNGDKDWFMNGCFHREDGPAIEYTNGYKSWYLNGVHYSEQEHKIAVRQKKLDRIRSRQ